MDREYTLRISHNITEMAQIFKIYWTLLIMKEILNQTISSIILFITLLNQNSKNQNVCYFLGEGRDKQVLILFTGAKLV